MPARRAGQGGNLDAFFDDGELKVVESSGRYEPRFKIVEIIEKLKEKPRSKIENFPRGLPILPASRNFFVKSVDFLRIGSILIVTTLFIF